MTTTTCDALIVGGGMAGASCGYFLADDARVVLLEREEQPGYHTTGRSAALFYESYGNATIRRITRATRPFLETPPDGFAGSVAVLAALMTLACLPSTAVWAAFGAALRPFLADPRRMRVFNIAMAVLLVLSLIPVVAT